MTAVELAARLFIGPGNAEKEGLEALNSTTSLFKHLANIKNVRVVGDLIELLEVVLKPLTWVEVPPLAPLGHDPDLLVAVAVVPPMVASLAVVKL